MLRVLGMSLLYNNLETTKWTLSNRMVMVRENIQKHKYFISTIFNSSISTFLI